MSDEGIYVEFERKNTHSIGFSTFKLLKSPKIFYD